MVIIIFMITELAIRENRQVFLPLQEGFEKKDIR
jgi:hypothetical protein